MNHLKAINTKAARVERATEDDVVGLQGFEEALPC